MKIKPVFDVDMHVLYVSFIVLTETKITDLAVFIIYLF